MAEPPGDAACSTASGTGAGRPSRPARSGSSPTRTSVPASASRRWRRGSPHGAAGIRRSTSTVARSAGTTRTCTPSGHAPTGSRQDVCRAAGVPPDEVRRLGWTGPALRLARDRDRSGTPGTDPMTHGAARLLLGRRRAVGRPRASTGSRPRSPPRPAAPMDRWLLRGNRNMATGLIGELHGRVATPVMFGGGTLAIVHEPGLARRQGRGSRRVPRRDRRSSRPATRW